MRFIDYVKTEFNESEFSIAKKNVHKELIKTKNSDKSGIDFERSQLLNEDFVNDRRKSRSLNLDDIKQFGTNVSIQKQKSNISLQADAKRSKNLSIDILQNSKVFHR